MAGPAVEYRDIESIIEGWKMHESPYYSLWQGSTLKFVNEEEDLTEAEDKLRQALQAIEAANTTAIYTLRIHRDGKVTNKKDYKGSFTFRLNEYDVLRPGGRAHGDGGIVVLNPGKSAVPAAAAPAAPGLEAKLDRLIELQAMMLERQMAEEEEDEEDDEEEEPEITQEQRMQNTIQMVSGITTALQPFINQILMAFGKAPSAETSFMSGTNDTRSNQDKLNEAIAILVQAVGEDKLVDSLQKLAKIAQENPGKLQMLMGMI